ncbi:MAG TPA: hypothetical protein PLZ15_00515 [Melioribacteraceae bacterium]|mgnify:CR=1 FL=1|nr:hypothetical protein [Melioribacteraceae bacterium]
MNQRLANNGNWKGGISFNRYHYTKKYRKLYPEQEPARKVVHRAIRSGKLAKPNYCQFPKCFKTEIFAHHVDYSKPLAVEWYCRKHHSLIHKGFDNNLELFADDPKQEIQIDNPARLVNPKNAPSIQNIVGGA